MNQSSDKGIRKFYYEHDEDEDMWAIMEESGGCEHGQYFDTLMFYCVSNLDAIDAVELLTALQKVKS